MNVRPSWHEARATAAVAASAAALPSEILALEHCVGRRLAHDFLTSIDLPHFASSAMDGWATVGNGPWALVDAEPAAGEARAIVTGGLVPDTVTAILRSESGQVANGVLHTSEPGEPRPRQHIRSAGREASRGETLISAGTVLDPAHIALAASAGVDSIAVQAAPGVSLILTGDEIVARGVPGPGQVRDSFGIQLPTVLALLGAHVGSAVRVGDRLETIVDALSDSHTPLLVTTGGTGTSAVDHVRSALAALHARILVDGVAMRPGGPTTIAELPDGRLVACLPGNPLAAMIAAITLCEPLIAGLAGRAARPTRIVGGVALAGRTSSTMLVPYGAVDGRTTIVPWQGSGMMRGLAEASGLLVVPETGTVEGEHVESIDLPWIISPR